MEVEISVGGRFHAFNLAGQLAKRGFLKRIITSYPKFETEKYGIPKDKIDSIITKELLERGWKIMPGFLKDLWDPQFFITETFDRLASKKIVSSDIFVGWANQSLFSLRKAKELGAIGIIERGSSHMAYQDQIIKEEYSLLGIKPKSFQLAHPKIIERELLEYNEANYISIPSSFVRRTFIESGVPESKLFQVPYGVELSAFHQILKEDGVFRVIFAGGLTIRKGVHYLLRAFSELKLPNSELLLIGTMNEEMKPFFKKYSRNYRCIGHVPQSELYRHYSQGSVFVLPSIEEGLGMVQLQAMACGLPIIATVNTGAEDIVRDGEDGFVIPIRDVEVIKEKILYFYEHPEERERMGRSAKERVSSGFTWDDYGARMVKAYEQILSCA